MATKNQIDMAFNAFIDDDTMATASATNVASAESIVAYIASLGAVTLVGVQKFTSSNTYTPTAGMKYCIVEIIGGGGGGGGVAYLASASVSAGGGGGAYCRKIYTAAQLGATGAVVIGAAGAGGSAGNNAGSGGGNSTFTPAGTGDVLTAGGGGGGSATGSTYTTAQITTGGGNGGTPTNGDVAIYGQNGSPGVLLGVASSTQLYSGNGGNSYFGSGGKYVTGGGGNGNSGFGYGAGGSGGATSGSNQAGGTGVAGYCIITEFA